MELIAKEKSRNTTYCKRKHGIIKKATEFSILCGVDTAMIIYPPNSNVPEIWPPNPEEIKKTIASYKSKKSDAEKRTYDLRDFYEDRKKKIEDELVKARKKNIEAKYATWFDGLDGLSEGQLRQFAMRLNNKENLVRAHLEFKKRNMNVQLPFTFGILENKMAHSKDQGLHPGLENGQVMNHGPVNWDHAWFGGAPMGSNIPMKQEQTGFLNSGVVDGGMVYAGQWGFQVPVVPEFVRQEHEELINNAVGEFVMDDPLGRFAGSI
ncbi:agamous-like MADS-box protein AGL82 [Bidens hawaiensis]|uniref:agamous-like MADS-box protein AGL82 n=1 Tax=Bidens hawaiensis TaxID=980011 RepID=UPI00404A703B